MYALVADFELAQSSNVEMITTLKFDKTLH
jgi:hypothetical protein